MNRTILLLAVLFLASCDATYDAPEEKIGAFVVRKHMGRDSLRWEGGNTYGRYYEICNAETAGCFVRGFGDGPYWARRMSAAWDVSPEGVHLILLANNGGDNVEELETIKLFKVRNGAELKCKNCEQFRNFGDHSFGYWRSESEFVGSSSRMLGAVQLTTYWLIVIKEEFFQVQALLETRSSNDAWFHGSAELSPKGDSLAWIVCDPDCLLIQRLIGTGETIVKPVVCRETDYSTVGWHGETAIYKC